MFKLPDPDIFVKILIRIRNTHSDPDAYLGKRYVEIRADLDPQHWPNGGNYVWVGEVFRICKCFLQIRVQIFVQAGPGLDPNEKHLFKGLKLNLGENFFQQKSRYLRSVGRFRYFMVSFLKIREDHEK